MKKAKGCWSPDNDRFEGQQLPLTAENDITSRKTTHDTKMERIRSLSNLFPLTLETETRSEDSERRSLAGGPDL